MINRFFEKIEINVVLPAIIGIIAAVLNLALTLNFTASVIIFILTVSIVLFCQSFSYGWLFLLGTACLFPSINIGSQMSVFNLFLIILIVISLAQFAIENYKMPRNRSSYYMFLMLLVGVSIIVFSFLFDGSAKKEVWSISISFALYLFMMQAFQHFFQTSKRINKFFKVIIAVCLIHAVFGLITFFGGWQTDLGMGISGGQMHHLLFSKVQYQINGFLGIGLKGLVGNNFLSVLLACSSMLTFGYYLKTRKDKSLSDKVKRNLFIFLIFIGLVQVVAMLLTFAYYSIISLAAGIITVGFIIKDKKVIVTAAAALIILAIIPSIIKPEIAQSPTSHFSSIESLKNNWILGNGLSKLRVEESPSAGIYNSYLFIWNYLGIAGLVILLGLMYSYFKDIYDTYLQARGEARLWLIIITGIFVIFALEAITGNVIIFGPSALIFWLLYATVINLRDNERPFKFSEQRIFNVKKFENIWGRKLKRKIVDGIKPVQKLFM